MKFIVFLAVLTANSFGFLALYKPEWIRKIKILHHILFFILVLSNLFAIYFFFSLRSFVFWNYVFLLILMFLLTRFKPGGKAHRWLGSLSLLSAILAFYLPF
ncbi:MAG: hypothetical protein H7A25_11550 [Leptospiraceae bacterium]|nr:hypothetical protein [Leptospiraceae bacterium]